MRILLFILSFLFANNISLYKVADVPTKALYLTQPKGETERLFILNQKGQVYIVQHGQSLDTPFLDISDRVHSSFIPGSEEGLLGLAFHPDYQSNGFFFLNYVNKNDTSIVSRFSVTDNPEIADPNSEIIIMELAQPFGNHNGGHLAFGPKDGMLYIGFGDGGKYGDPYNHSQNTKTLLGALLRIDVNRPGPYGIPIDNPFYNESDKSIKKEIWSYGLRNPWRFSFDRDTQDLLLGDVGLNLWEEINWTTWEDSRGANFGWRTMEGNHCYSPEDFCDTTGLIMPVHEYPNNAAYMKILIGMDESESKGCSVTGGYVYRGKENPSLVGTYIFGDYCTGRIWSFKLQDGKPYQFRNLRREIKKHTKNVPLFISSFGEDSLGELYVVDYLGSIYKFISSP